MLRRIYTLVFILALPLILLRLAWRGLASPAYWRGWPQRFGFVSDPAEHKDAVWIHAVSVGEVNAVTPLVRRLAKEYPSRKIVVTTMTPTGADCARRQLVGLASHYYVPYDLPFTVDRFLTSVTPSLLVLVETELWPNMLHCCHVRRIPAVIVNARLSVRSFSGYRRLNSLTRDMLGKVAKIAAQSQQDAQRLITLGADPTRVVVAGNLKFDIQPAADNGARAAALRAELGVARPIWIAASTHEGEEALVLDAHSRIKTLSGSALLVIAPRHPERFNTVADMIRERGFNVRRWSEGPRLAKETEVLLLDTMGDLVRFYAGVDVAFVGGSLVPTGGHNLLEPAAVGTPVITGPNLFNFAEIHRLLKDADAIHVVESVEGLAKHVGELLEDGRQRAVLGERAKRVVQANRGAVSGTMQHLREYLGSNGQCG